MVMKRFKIWHQFNNVGKSGTVRLMTGMLWNSSYKLGLFFFFLKTWCLPINQLKIEEEKREIQLLRACLWHIRLPRDEHSWMSSDQAWWNLSPKVQPSVCCLLLQPPYFSPTSPTTPIATDKHSWPAHTAGNFQRIETKMMTKELTHQQHLNIDCAFEVNKY